jgi:hypothetical protein
MFKETFNIWMQRCINKDIVNTRLAVNTQEQRDELNEFKNVIITNQSHVGTVYPAYLLTTTLEVNPEDIIIFASDDFYPPENWDEYLLNKFENFDGALFVRDGYQIPGNDSIKASITIPIMTYNCLCKLNKVLYHPDYIHYYADTELYSNLLELGLLKDDRIKDLTTFEHMNCVTGKRKSDEIDAKYNSTIYTDMATYKRRLYLSLESRLVI